MLTAKLRHEILALGGVREPQLSLFRRHRSALDQMKRFGDIVIACVLLAITLPLMVFVALAIKWESSGPVLDRQACIGIRGRRFQMVRFRTTEPTPEWAQKMTRVGQLLRYTRIEALPQLVNVLRGEMGIIDGEGRSPLFLE